MDRRTRLSAAAIVLIVAGVFLWSFLPGGSSIAWAQVVQRLQNVKTVTFKAVLTAPDGRQLVYDMALQEPDLMRYETRTPVHMIGITNFSSGEMLSLMPDEKLAIPIKLGDLARNPQQNLATQDWFGRIKRLVDEPRQPLGQKRIGSVQAEGFRITKGNESTVVWVNPQTGLPAEIEFGILLRGAKVTTIDWQFDTPLDPKLFEMKVPEGYRSRLPVELSTGIEDIEDVAGTLKLWAQAQARGGTFPDNLALTLFQRDLGASGMKLSPEQERQRVKGFLFLTKHRQAIYAGQGVKLGDAQTPIYWYQPKDSPTCKVIYGDLSIRDVAPNALPTTKPATTPAK